VNIILDTNLLLLFVVGMTEQEYVVKHKRLSAYTIADFHLLLDMLSAAKAIVVTPNTLTETSNLIKHINEPARSHIYGFFQKLVKATETEERFIESRIAVDRPEFLRLGLTDSALLQVGAESHTLLTADLNLYLAASQLGLMAENFNHHRNL
jgi:hypothetical protein